MGVKAKEREEADRVRRIKARRQGDTKGKYLTVALTVPTPLIREIAQTESTDEAWEVWKDYEFEVELTKDGILFRPYKVVSTEGW